MISILNLCSNILLADYPCVFITRSYELDEAIAAGAQVDGLIGRLDQSCEPEEGEERITFSVDDGGNTIANFVEHAAIANGNPTTADGADSVDITHQAFVHMRKYMVQTLHREGKSDTLAIPSCRFFETRYTRLETLISYYNYIYISRILRVNLTVYAFGSLPYAIIAGLTHFHAGQSTRAQRILTMTWLTFGIFVGLLPVAWSKQVSTKAIWGRGKIKSQVRYFSSGVHKQNYFEGFRRNSSYLLYSAPAIGGFVVVGQMLKDYGYCTLIT